MSKIKTLLDEIQDDDKYLDDEYQVESQRGFKTSPHNVVFMNVFDHLFGGAKSNRIKKPKDEARDI
tara:strand:- start:18574 stop:18771 length:198 start_codon:yes stop_codon:yes gene_type:complete